MQTTSTPSHTRDSSLHGEEDDGFPARFLPRGSAGGGRGGGGVLVGGVCDIRNGAGVVGGGGAAVCQTDEKPVQRKRPVSAINPNGPNGPNDSCVGGHPFLITWSLKPLYLYRACGARGWVDYIV